MRKITFFEDPVTLPDVELKVGDQAPDFTVLNTQLDEVSFYRDYKSGVRVVCFVPSIDSGVCSLQTRRFNMQASNLEGVKLLTISCDLPFAQERWCAAEGLPDVILLSDHKETSAGEAFGTTMKEFRLLARSVFVVDSTNTITYIQFAEEGTNHLNYKEALEAVKVAK